MTKTEDISSSLQEPLISSARSYEGERNVPPVVYQAENLVNIAVPVLAPPTGPGSTTAGSCFGRGDEDDITPVSVVVPTRTASDEEDAEEGRGTRTTAGGAAAPPAATAAAVEEESRRRRQQSYSKEWAFILASLATIVAVEFFIAAVPIIGDLWDDHADDHDDDTNFIPFLMILVACYIFLLTYGVIAIWRVYRRGNHDDDDDNRHEDYRLVELWSLFLICSALGFLLLGPMGVLLGAAVAAILWYIIHHDHFSYCCCCLCCSREFSSPRDL
jgi:hypothetical protein